LYSETSQTWYGLAEKDPLYLFTLHGFRENVQDLFSKSLEPLFRYLQAVYGPSFRFDNGSLIEEFRNPPPLIHEITTSKNGRLEVSNFEYETTQEFVRNLSVWKALRVAPKTDGSVWRSELTIIVPKNTSHPFWTGTQFGWKHEDERDTEYYQFTVRKYGGSGPDANYQATASGIGLIRCARNNDKVNCPRRMSFVQPCPTLELGRRLHTLFQKKWRDVRESEGFWNEVKATLGEMIKEESRKHVLLLLKYYKVQFISCEFRILDYILLNTSHAHCGAWATLEKLSNYSKRWSDVFRKTYRNVIDQNS
jgi:hypothetical protein